MNLLNVLRLTPELFESVLTCILLNLPRKMLVHPFFISFLLRSSLLVCRPGEGVAGGVVIKECDGGAGWQGRGRSAGRSDSLPCKELHESGQPEIDHRRVRFYFAG